MHRQTISANCGPGLTVVALALSGIAAGADAPTVTPYRPSVSTPAALSAPGWLELEAGLQSSHGNDPARRQSLPYTLKLAFTPDWGMRIGGDANVRQQAADGSTIQGLGDTSIVLKRRFELNEQTAWGLELGAKLPTAHAGLGSDHTDLSVNAIYSADLAQQWHLDLNLVLTQVGAAAPGTSRSQQAWALALSRNLSPQWGLVWEASGTHQSGAPATRQALLAASYGWSPGLSLDIGTSKGLNTASGGWSLFSGLTWLTARLF